MKAPGHITLTWIFAYRSPAPSVCTPCSSASPLPFLGSVAFGWMLVIELVAGVSSTAVMVPTLWYSLLPMVQYTCQVPSSFTHGAPGLKIGWWALAGPASAKAPLRPMSAPAVRTAVRRSEDFRFTPTPVKGSRGTARESRAADTGQ